MTWRRVYADLSHNYHFSIEQINAMTEIQVQLYISQIVWVSPLERIRYYLRDIKHVLFSFFVKNYETQEEIEEEVEKVKEIKPKSKLSKREQIIADCEKLGLKLPKR